MTARVALHTTVPFNELTVTNAQTDRFGIHGVHHIRFLSGDAHTTALRHEVGMGMQREWKSDSTTGNHNHASYVVTSGDVRLAFQTPYAARLQRPGSAQPLPMVVDDARQWVDAHHFGVRTIAVNVDDAREAYTKATEAGALGLLPPKVLEDHGGHLRVATIKLYGTTDRLTADAPGFDRSGQGVRMLFVEGADQYDGFFPGYNRVIDQRAPQREFGIRAVDHIVHNTTDMMATIRMLERILGLHVFAIFRESEVGDPRSALNSVVMANNSRTLLLPVNEGVDRAERSQITWFLDANNGPGIQHIAFRTENLMGTLHAMGAARLFSFLQTPEAYYRELTGRVGGERVSRIVGGTASHEDYVHLVAELQRLGILVGIDSIHPGVLFQIFTQPISADQTIFYELIQRACENGVFVPGCGAFGLDNFNALYQAIARLQRESGGHERARITQ